jgi:hypothetical protein
MSTEAARGAADALRGIEAWGRRIFVAATVGASCLAILAGVVVYLAADYLRSRWALQDALTKADRADQRHDQARAHARRAAVLRAFDRTGRGQDAPADSVGRPGEATA